MADDGERVDEVSEGAAANSVTREELNEVMSTFKSSMAIEVKNMLKDFLDNYKTSTDPLLMVNPTSPDSGGDSEKGNASSEKDKMCEGTSGANAFTSVPPPLVYGGPVHPPRIINLGPPPKLVKNDFANWVFRIKSHFI